MAAAAAADSVQRIKAEATCSICLGLLRDPVTTACGHSFCERCITRLCEGREDAACPQCRQPLPEGSLKPNKKLRSIVALFRPQAEEKPAGWNMCETHQEPLKLYCNEDQMSICLVCMQSQAHRGHTVVPKEEAVQEYRGKIAEQLEVIESSCGKLHQFVKQVWEHLPEYEREEEYQSVKRVSEKLTTVLQERTETPGQRSGESHSQPLASPSPARDVSEETELEGHSGREPGSEPADEKQEETRSHVGHVCEEAPTPKEGLDQTSLDQFIHTISNTTEAAQCMEAIQQHLEGIKSECEKLNACVSTGQMHLPESAREEARQSVKRLIDYVATLLKVAEKETRKRPKDGSSLTPAEGSGGSRTDGSSASSGEEGKGAPARDRKQRNPLLPPTPAPVPEPPHQTEQHSGREPGSEPAAEKQEETGTHVSPVGQKDPTSKHELSQGSLDDAFHMISGTRGDAEPKVAEKKTMKRPLTPAEGSGGSRTDAIPASSTEEGAAMGSGTEAAGEGQQRPAKKRKDNEN